MIGTRSLLRTAVRSFYGLVSFLCTRYPSLTPELAMQRLQAAGANLQVADPNLDDMPNAMRKVFQLKKPGSYSGCGCGRLGAVDAPSASVEEAYAAAAAAACHPKASAQQALLGSSDAPDKLKHALDMLWDAHSCQLTSKDLELISLSLKCPSSLGKPHQEDPPVPRKLSTYTLVASRRNMFWDQHAGVLRKVKAALETYNRQPGAPKYKLHVICGVNELVFGPEYDKVIKFRSHPWSPYKYHHSHINFLATCKDSQSASALAELFFAECSNDGIDEVYLCCPVSLPHSAAEQVRCIYCEHEGSRIVHPAVESFQRRGIEFEKLLRRERLFGMDSEQLYSNEHLISNSSEVTYWVDGLEDDCIYSIDYANEDEKEEGRTLPHRISWQRNI